MRKDTEYQIYIGCHDSQLKDEVVSEDELRETATRFFEQKQIGFSMYSAKGGYLHKDGTFVSESTLCINIIGGGDLDIIKLAKALSMFMNQECSLVLKEAVKLKYC